MRRAHSPNEDVLLICENVLCFSCGELERELYVA